VAVLASQEGLSSLELASWLVEETSQWVCNIRTPWTPCSKFQLGS